MTRYSAILLLVLCLAGCSKPQPPNLLDQDPGFTFELPANWWVDDLDPNTATQTAWTDKANHGKIFVAVTPLKPDEQKLAASIEDYGNSYVQYGILQNSRFSGVSIDKSEPSSLGGEPAYEIVFSATMNQKPRWRRTVLATIPNRPNRLVTLAFMADPGQESNYRDQFQQVLDSWKWN